jgi:hypothetical protein
MNIIAFVFYAGLFCFFAGVGVSEIPLELVIAVCALILAIKSI